MRYIVVDWLAEVHSKMDLQSETFHLTVQLLDRYLEQVNVTKQTFQLVAVSCLLVAAKYQETFAPTLTDCVHLIDERHSRQAVLDMELDVLRTLDFRVSFPTAFHFCQRFLYLAMCGKRCSYLSHYYLESTQQDVIFLNFQASLVATAAVCLAINHPKLCEVDRPVGFVSSSSFLCIMSHHSVVVVVSLKSCWNTQGIPRRKFCGLLIAFAKRLTKKPEWLVIDASELFNTSTERVATAKFPRNLDSHL